jgi:hypothetical protein
VLDEEADAIAADVSRFLVRTGHRVTRKEATAGEPVA